MVPSTGAVSFVFSNFANRSATVASASATLASATARSSAVGPALRRGGLRPLELEVGLGLGKRGRAFVELLATGKLLGRQRDGADILLLSQQEIGLGRSHGIGGDRDLFGPHTRINPVPLGFGACRGRLGFPHQSRQVWIVEDGEKVPLADMLAGLDGD